MDEKSKKIEILKSQIENKNNNEKQRIENLHDKRVIKRKLHNILKNDSYFFCKEFELKNEIFNRKILNFMEKTSA